jgi:hypothetical protein
VSKGRARVSTALPDEWHKKVNVAVALRGFTMQEKYKWISESIFELVQVDGYMESLVETARYPSPGSRHMVFSLTPEANEILIDIEEKFKEKYSPKQGSKSTVLRAAILHKIIIEVGV